MQEKEIICTVCPIGCHIFVQGEKGSVTTMHGFTCKRGEAYAIDEFNCPKRTLTSTVRIINGSEILLPVRTERPVPLEKTKECMEAIKASEFEAPIKIHDVLIPNIAGTSVNLIACSSVNRCS